MKDFDLSTKEGFLNDFDKLEKAVLEGRNKIGEEIANAFLEESGKKNSSKNPKNAKQTAFLEGFTVRLYMEHSEVL